jgi:hypothetical protein
MRFQFLAITCMTWIAMSYWPICLALPSMPRMRG